MATYLLGIDVGTSSCKAALFKPDGGVTAQESGEYPVYYPAPGLAEQDPRQWWHAVCGAVRACILKAGISPGEICGVGVAGQSWSAIAVDKDGEVLCNNPIWMDTRADAICRQLEKETSADEIFRLCGNPVKPCYTTGKILWYREKRPEIYRRIHKILQSNSYIVYCLTGKMTQELSQGYGLHCFDMRRGRWDADMAARLGVEPSFLP